MTLKTFAASEVATSEEMNKAAFQLPNSVIYGALQTGVTLSTNETDYVKLCEIMIDVLIGRYLMLVHEVRTTNASYTAFIDARFILPDGSDLGFQGATGIGSASFVQTAAVFDLANDGLVDARGVRCRVEFWGKIANGLASMELKNMAILGGGSSAAADYGY